MSELSQESKFRHLQLSAVSAWSGSPDSPFEVGVALAIKGWDKVSTFVILELGCGTGGNSAKLIKYAKEKIRGENGSAMIQVYQMDLPGISQADLTIHAGQWQDDRCQFTFLPQSFYDPFQIDGGVNLVFSQSSIHWVPLDQEPLNLSKQDLASDETRQRARRCFRKLLDNVEAKMAPSGIFACMCLGSDVPGRLLPIFEWMVDMYGAGFKKAESSDAAGSMMMKVPQVPHALTDLEEELVARNFTWISGASVGSGTTMAQMSQDVARPTAQAMLAVFWPDWLEKQVWPNKSRAERQEFMTKAEQGLAEALCNTDGFSSDQSSIIAFVAQFK